MYLIATINERKIECARTYDRLIELGVSPDNIIIDFGFKPSDCPNLKRDYHTVLYRFIDFRVPKMIDYDDDFVYLEDNVYPLKRVEDIDIDKQKINWLGYIFNHKSYIGGFKYIYFPKEVLKEIPTKVQPLRMQHIDRWIRNYAIKNNILKIDQNYIKLYRSESCWGTPEQKKRKEVLKEPLFLADEAVESTIPN